MILVAEKNEQERRKSQRVCLQQSVTVKYDREGNFEFAGISGDLSAGGIFLYTESIVEEGARVELTLTFPSKSGQSIPMQVRGRVIRVQRTPKKAIAVEFDKVTVVPEASRGRTSALAQPSNTTHAQLTRRGEPA